MEFPRLSAALRAKLGVKPVPLDQALVARKSQLDAAAATPAPAPAPELRGTLSWDVFAGPLSRSNEPHVRAARADYNKFLAAVREIAGGDEANEGLAGDALFVYVTLAAASAPSSAPPSPAADKALASRLTAHLHFAASSVTAARLRALKEAVAALVLWRGLRKIAPPLDTAFLRGDAEASSLVAGGWVYTALDATEDLPAVQAVFRERFGPLLVLEPRSALHAVAEDAAAGAYGSAMSRADVAAIAAAAAATSAAVSASSLSSISSSSASSARPADAAWLYAQCAQFIALSRGAHSPDGLGSAVLEVMRLHRADEGALQGSLFDLLGEAGFEFMLTLMQQRQALSAIAPQDFRRVAAALVVAGGATAGNGLAPRLRPVTGAGVTVARESDLYAEKERRKAEKKLVRARSTLLDLAHEGFVDGGGASGSGPNDGGFGGGDALEMLGFSPEYLALERSLGLQGGEAPPVYGNVALRPKAQGTSEQGLRSADDVIASVGAGFAGATKKALPEGTTEVVNKEGGFCEVCVPPQQPPGGRAHFEDKSRLVAVSSMDPLAQQAFKGISHLNRLQSELFESAYRSSENLLVCAPTGAGKTNVAMLTVCREAAQHVSADGRSVRRDEFKVIYVAPMKALAQEVVAKFSQRLQSLGLKVRELTGDMQLTKQEIADTQVIVTTPEKWDVVTRKSGDGSLVALVRLLIIDEVHLLADERGAVIESIVARTLRLVETSQSVIRIVGLSATLPNYKDVATFLRVNPTKGLFYFDNAYRPVPLQQTFIGVTEVNTMKRANVMNRIAWDKALAAVRRGKQVMVFVHSRKDTAKTARALRDLASADGMARMLSPFGSSDESEVTAAEGSPGAPVSTAGADGAPAAVPAAPGQRRPPGSAAAASSASAIQGEGRMSLSMPQWVAMQRDIEKSRNAEVRELFPAGFGTHHAGMLRSDRSLTESMFAAGVIKILCCTATLAWGVNLPAHTVIIKGTQVYSAEAGGFADLGYLDVMQIFGRAGRPQFDTSGEGIIITGGEKLSHYLGLLTAQVPIESSFIKALPDHLNAEVVSGTVTNVREAVLWLSYTYLYVRMMRNPIVYGIGYEERLQDPLLEAKRLQLITQAARRLDECHMLRFDPSSGNMAVTDLGRVASHYYVVCESIDTFNRMIDKSGLGAGGGKAATEEVVLALVCHAHEFTQVKVRDEELGELDFLKGEARVLIKGDVASTVGKVNVLLQAFIGNVPLRSFTLISDTAYITQSAGRISRALFEICLKKGWYTLADKLLMLSKAVDKRTWWTASPLRQFMGVWGLAPEVVKKLEESRTPVDELADLQPIELGNLVRHPKLGPRLWSLVRQVPRLAVETHVQPITRNVLRLTVLVYPSFDWSEKVHGSVEPWWLWVTDADCEHIFHSEYLLLTRRQVESGEPVRLVLTIPIFEPLPTQYWLHWVSDRWLGLQSAQEVNFRNLVLPSRHAPHTELLDLLPLPLAALRNRDFEALYEGSFTHFNPVQSQMFFTVYSTDANVLLGAPTGSGKTVAAELAVFRLLAAHPGMKVVYIAPLKALVSERLRDWQRKFGQKLGRRVVELTGDVTPDAFALRTADIIITTPEKWDGITRGWRRRNFVQHVGLVIIDEVHLLGEERGPVLEVIVSRMRYIAARTGQPIRFQGLSTALANAHDLAGWLGVEAVGLFNFRPSVRPIPMEVHVQGFPGQHYCPRMASMNKPAFAAITTHSPDKPVLVFVASRRQTRLTALELISLSAAAADNPKRFLRMSDEEVAAYAARVRDPSLQHTLAFGVGIHHAGLAEGDRAIVEELFCAVKIQVLVCTSTLAWGVNFPAHLVVVKGTEFFDAKLGRYVDFPVTDVLQMMGRAGRPQFDTQGVSVILVHEPKKNFYRKFLYEPFPVESQLRAQLAEHLNAEVAGGSIACRDDAVEYLTWTFFYRRLPQNPAYYELEDATAQGTRDYLYALVDNVFGELEASGCVLLREDALKSLAEERAAGDDIAEPLPLADEAVAGTTLGTISSYYYLSHRSAGLFSERLEEPALARPSVEAVCRLLCDSPEFAEVPVRHNEDELNERLARDLPWAAAGPRGGTGGSGSGSAAPDFSSAHVKAFLLLQARMARAPLPIADYVNDTKSVLDQSLRVLNALIDVAAAGRRLDAALAAMRLAQCVVQARLPDAPEAAQLPHIDAHQAVALATVLLQRPEWPDPSTLRGLAQRRDAELRQALGSPAVGLAPLQAAEAVRVLRALPQLEVHWSWSVVAPSKTTSGAGIGSAGGGVFSAPEGAELSLAVELQAPPAFAVGRHAYAPRFRQKIYGWWLVVGDRAKRELLAIKRVSLQSGVARLALPLVAPLAGVAAELTLYVLSDTLIGVDLERLLVVRGES